MPSLHEGPQGFDELREHGRVHKMQDISCLGNLFAQRPDILVSEVLGFMALESLLACPCTGSILSSSVFGALSIKVKQDAALDRYIT